MQGYLWKTLVTTQSAISTGTQQVDGKRIPEKSGAENCTALKNWRNLLLHTETSCFPRSWAKKSLPMFSMLIPSEVVTKHDIILCPSPEGKKPEQNQKTFLFLSSFLQNNAQPSVHGNNQRALCIGHTRFLPKLSLTQMDVPKKKNPELHFFFSEDLFRKGHFWFWTVIRAQHKSAGGRQSSESWNEFEVHLLNLLQTDADLWAVALLLRSRKTFSLITDETVNWLFLLNHSSNIYLEAGSILSHDLNASRVHQERYLYSKWGNLKPELLRGNLLESSTAHSREVFSGENHLPVSCSAVPYRHSRKSMSMSPRTSVPSDQNEELAGDFWDVFIQTVVLWET